MTESGRPGSGPGRASSAGVSVGLVARRVRFAGRWPSVALSGVYFPLCDELGRAQLASASQHRRPRLACPNSYGCASASLLLVGTWWVESLTNVRTSASVTATFTPRLA